MKINNCSIDFSKTGRICTIYAENGRIIAQLRVHGPLVQCAINASEGQPIAMGRPNMFRGEAYALSSYEILDIEREEVIEK